MTYFPSEPFSDAGSYALAYFARLAGAANTVSAAEVTRAGELLSRTVHAGGRIYSCGNGGSAAIANHLCCDCLKGARTNSLIKPKVYSLAATVELLTAIANDVGFEDIFAYQLASLGAPGDVLIAISASGASPNIIKALSEAKALGMSTIAMTGFGGGAAAAAADISLHVDAQNYGLVEDTHQSLMHVLAQFLRQAHIEDPGLLGRTKF
jgi:D-sedoheptulose 7-phosphate isomerase